MKYFFFIMISALAFSCSSSSEQGSGKYNLSIGDCVEEPFGIYTFKVVGMDKNIVTAKPIGGIGSSMARFDLNRQQLLKVSCP